jgi:tungstate transport system substrate-binding protein
MQIADAKAPFASRGDDSGTNRMELRLWKSAGIRPEWLVS